MRRPNDDRNEFTSSDTCLRSALKSDSYVARRSDYVVYYFFELNFQHDNRTVLNPKPSECVALRTRKKIDFFRFPDSSVNIS